MLTTLILTSTNINLWCPNYLFMWLLILSLCKFCSGIVLWPSKNANGVFVWHSLSSIYWLANLEFESGKVQNNSLLISLELIIRWLIFSAGKTMLFGCNIIFWSCVMHIQAAVFYFHDEFTWLKGAGLFTIMFGVSLFNWYK